MKRVLATVLAVSVVFTSQVFAEERDSTKTAEGLAQILVDSYGISSVQYALSYNGEIVLSDGYASEALHGTTEVSSDTMYGIGSVSKMYVTTAAMILADQGLLDIDAPIVSYIPEFTMQDERYTEITARMLMNHSAGFHGSLLRNAFLFNDNDTQVIDRFLDSLSEQDLKADPAKFSVYSNDGFTMLEILVERISGMSFTEFLQTYIFEPLAFEHTKTPQDVFDQAKVAPTFSPFYQGALPVAMLNAIGTGGIFANAEEVVKFADVLMGNRTDILSAESAEAMAYEEYSRGMWVSETENSIGYGLGWDAVHLFPFGSYGIQGLNKGGDTLVFHSTLVALPEHNLAMAVHTSGGSSGINMMLASRVMEQFLLEEGLIAEILPELVTMPPVQQEMPEDMKQYNGLYAAAGLADVKFEDGQLIVKVEAEGQVFDQYFVYVGDGEFKDETGANTIRVEEHAGETYLMLRTISSVPGFGSAFVSQFDGQRVESTVLTDDVRAAWEARKDTRYMILSEKATSQFYFAALQLLMPTLQIDVENGFVGGNRIVDENYAAHMVDVPVTAGRDSLNLLFYTENDKEYLQIRDYTFMNERYVETLFAGDAICSIAEDGYARWYWIGEGSANRTVQVDMPENGAFAVYTAEGMPVQFSTVTGLDTVVLPENGAIVFIGEPNTVFRMNF